MCNRCFNQTAYGERAVELIEWHNSTTPDDPMFLYIAFQAPHSPLQVSDLFIVCCIFMTSPLRFAVGPRSLHGRLLTNFSMCVPLITLLLQVVGRQNSSTEGCSKLKRSVNMTSSGKNGLNIRTNASPKWDRTRCPEE